MLLAPRWTHAHSVVVRKAAERRGMTPKAVTPPSVFEKAIIRFQMPASSVDPSSSDRDALLGSRPMTKAIAQLPPIMAAKSSVNCTLLPRSGCPTDLYNSLGRIRTAATSGTNISRLRKRLRRYIAASVQLSVDNSPALGLI